MFFKKEQRTVYQGIIGTDVDTGIAFGFQNHPAEFQSCIPLIFKPFIIFHTSIVALRTFPRIFTGIGQTEILHLFGKAGAIVLPVITATPTRIVEQTAVILELAVHHVHIAALKHGEIDQPLVLRRKSTASPITEIGAERPFGVHIHRVEGKQASVEFGRIATVGIASQLITEKLIVTA